MVRTRTKDYGYYLNHNNNSMSYDDNLESSDEDDISSQFSTRMNISTSDNKDYMLNQLFCKKQKVFE